MRMRRNQGDELSGNRHLLLPSHNISIILITIVIVIIFQSSGEEQDDQSWEDVTCGVS